MAVIVPHEKQVEVDEHYRKLYSKIYPEWWERPIPLWNELEDMYWNRYVGRIKRCKIKRKHAVH